MRSSRHLLLLAMLGGAFFAAGCGSTTPGTPAAPTPSAVATAAPSSTSAAGPTSLTASSPAPTDTGDDLASLMPASMGGGTCTSSAYPYDQIASSISAEAAPAFETLASASGVAIETLSFGEGSCVLGSGEVTTTVGFDAYLAPGANPTKLADAYVAYTRAQGRTPVLGSAVIAGRTVVSMTVDSQVIYLFQKGQVLFIYPSVNAQVDATVIGAF